ncbi:uncharacterized protein LOC132705066 [Cylas formicarius]|uniref:uncharacterized protein LOC132705066 n=1 Tax=Cylas formicarius TaxID=197179 RepID=UPI002958953A|nr:uncharacterized protein LOC132705066 [Cylas formicarius]
MASRDTALYCILLAYAIKKKQKMQWLVQRSKWTKDWLVKRNDLKLEKQDWFNYLRVDETTYLKLLKFISSLIQKQDTCMRQSISCHERLTATLRFLATGRTYEDLKFSTIISPQALRQIILETCRVFPQSEEDWKAIVKQLEQRSNFPHCLGAVDGKHVNIVPSPGGGSYFFNYRAWF